MSFVKKTWKDRLVEFPGRRLLTKISGSADEQMVVDVTRNEGIVSQSGDVFSAANMNDLEQRIGDEFDEISNDLGGCSFETREDGAYVKYTLPGGADPVVKKLGDETPQYFEGYSGSAYSMKGKTIDAKNIILLLHAHTYRHKINENIIDGQMIELGEYLSSGTDSNSNAVTIITKIFYCKSNNNTITFMNNGVEKTGSTLCSYGTYNIIKLQ